MIGSLSGVLSELDLSGEVASEAVLEVHGVGYRVTLGARHAATLGAVGSAVSLSVHTHVREGAITLYGFESASERRTFELLLSTHGVGPALALAILGVHSPDALSKAIATGDVDALALVPGVGKKTAQRLVLELASRLELLGPPGTFGSPASEQTAVELEVRDALGSLGYGNEEIRHAMEGLQQDSVEQLLRAALHELAPRR